MVDAALRERVASCICGGLQIVVRGEPRHLHGCTCKRCQRKSGSVMTVSAWYPESQVVSITGACSAWAPDGPASETVFCPTCGGGGYFRTGDYLPDCIGIRIGTFADPSFPKPPHIHWWANRPHWLPAPEGIELLDGN